MKYRRVLASTTPRSSVELAYITAPSRLIALISISVVYDRNQPPAIARTVFPCAILPAGRQDLVKEILSEPTTGAGCLNLQIDHPKGAHHGFDPGAEDRSLVPSASPPDGCSFRVCQP